MTLLPLTHEIIPISEGRISQLEEVYLKPDNTPAWYVQRIDNLEIWKTEGYDFAIPTWEKAAEPPPDSGTPFMVKLATDRWGLTAGGEHDGKYIMCLSITKKWLEETTIDLSDYITIDTDNPDDPDIAGYEGIPIFEDNEERNPAEIIGRLVSRLDGDYEYYFVPGIGNLVYAPQWERPAFSFWGKIYEAPLPGASIQFSSKLSGFGWHGTYDWGTDWDKRLTFYLALPSAKQSYSFENDLRGQYFRVTVQDDRKAYYYFSPPWAATPTDEATISAHYGREISIYYPVW